MITLKKLKLNNYLSHKDTEIVFKENTKLSIQGISGSGKSSIVESILWVLFGKGRVENRNIIKRGAKYATVVLEVLDDKKNYRIERNVTLTGKHTLDIGEKKGKAFSPLKHIGLRDAQIWIEKTLLKSSYTLFINSVAYPQDNIESFVKQTAIKRKELLLEIADTENYDELYEKSKNELDKIRDESVRSEMILVGLNSEIAKKEVLVKELPMFKDAFNTCSTKVEELKKRVAEAKEAEAYIKGNQAQISFNKVKLGSMKIRVEELGKATIEKTNKIKEIEGVDPEIAIAGKKRLELVRGTLEMLHDNQKEDYNNDLKRQALISGKRPQNDYTGNLERLEGQLLDIFSSNDSFCEHLGRNCPKLENEIKNKSIFIEEQIKDIKERMTKQVEDNRAYEAALSAIPTPLLYEEDLINLKKLEDEEKRLSIYDNQAAADEKEKTIAYLKKEIEDAEMTLIMLNGDIEELEGVNKALEAELLTIKHEDANGLEIDLDAQKTEFFFLQNKIELAEKAEKDIMDILVEKGKLMVKEGATMANKECLEIAKEAFGSKGIKTVIIDYLIPRLEYRINEILSKMSDFKIRLETQKSKFDGEGMTEGLFINIYNEAGECFPLANYSGGQKMKITIAISEALASMQKCSFRIFDEIFTALDENSLEGFSEVIHSLQDKFSQILCISHLRTIQDSFEDKLMVVKEGDNSKII